jgi:hypothetical protein
MNDNLQRFANVPTIVLRRFASGHDFSRAEHFISTCHPERSEGPAVRSLHEDLFGTGVVNDGICDDSRQGTTSVVLNITSRPVILSEANDLRFDRCTKIYSAQASAGTTRNVGWKVG